MWVALALVLAVARRRAATLVLTVLAVLAADGLTDVVKVVVGERRPRFPHPLVAMPHSNSFPSGHTATAFAGATVLSALHPRAAPAFVLLAAAIAYSRLYVGVHFPLDVAGGFGIGVATALLLLAATRRRSGRSRRRG